MMYGGGSETEQEVIIRLDREGQQAHICSTWPAWSRKLERRYGSPKRVTEREGKVASAFWTIPLNLVSLRRGTKRPRTETQREAARERMRRVHQRRSVPPAADRKQKTGTISPGELGG